MQTRMTINAGDMTKNIKTLKEHIKVPIIAVVKMNGYGITIENAVDIWYQNEVRFFAADETSEVMKILSLGYDDIHIL
ncbi:MAG: alanine racemase, partial [Oscillospiraceae bacterium]|nr:alanine racemase [Oscillospiraceae bacterium]